MLEMVLQCSTKRLAVNSKKNEKASQCGAFFIPACLILCCSWISGPAADCLRFTEGPSLGVAHVYDGDTLRLEDGRKVRLIGINTPEIGHENEPDEPFALTAKERLVQILRNSDNRTILRIGKEMRDRHARVLAHIYDTKGQNITEILLREGLGAAVYLPPNIANLSCYRRAEESARVGRLGIWSQSDVVVEAHTLTGKETGYHLVRGLVERIGKSRRSVWLNLQQGPAIRIDWSDWGHFDEWRLDDLPGQRLEVRGWLYLRKGQQRLQVRHPAAIKRL